MIPAPSAQLHQGAAASRHAGGAQGGVGGGDEKFGPAGRYGMQGR